MSELTEAMRRALLKLRAYVGSARPIEIASLATIKKLETAGLVEIIRPSRRRAHKVKLTDAGRTVAELLREQGQ